MTEQTWRLLADKQRKTISNLQKQLTAMSKLNHALAGIQPAPVQQASRMRSLRAAVKGCLAMGLQGALPMSLQCLPDQPAPHAWEQPNASKEAAVKAARVMVPSGTPDRRKKLVNAARKLTGRKPLGIVPEAYAWENYV